MDENRIIKIGGQRWYISMVEEVDVLGDKGGLCNFDKNIIYLRSGRNPEAISETLIHEIIHILLYQSGMDRYLIGEMSKEELIVTSLANGIIQVLTDNAAIAIEYIYGLEKPKERGKCSTKKKTSKRTSRRKRKDSI